MTWEKARTDCKYLNLQNFFQSPWVFKTLPSSVSYRQVFALSPTHLLINNGERQVKGNPNSWSTISRTDQTISQELYSLNSVLSKTQQMGRKGETEIENSKSKMESLEFFQRLCRKQKYLKMVGENQCESKVSNAYWVKFSIILLNKAYHLFFSPSPPLL